MVRAKVEEVKGDRITLNMEQPEHCEECDSLACAVAGRRKATVNKPHNMEIKQGDTLEVSPRKGIMWGTAFILFVLPLFFFSAGTYLGYNLKLLPLSAEMNGIIGGAILLIISLPLIRHFGKKYTADGETLEIKKVESS
jgi:positive regulator of sigma E activity